MHQDMNKIGLITGNDNGSHTHTHTQTDDICAEKNNYLGYIYRSYFHFAAPKYQMKVSTTKAHAKKKYIAAWLNHVRPSIECITHTVVYCLK